MTLDEFFRIGVTVPLGTHTFTPEAIVSFARKFDPQPFHLSEETAQGSVFGRLTAFFVRTELTRHAIVATKAATQVFAHLAKIIVYGLPLVWAAGGEAPSAGLPPLWVFALAIPLSMIGTWCGGLILEKMTDVNFKRWTRWIVTAVGVVYLAQGIQLLLSGAG